MARNILAIDVGGTKLAVGMMSPDGAMHGAIIEPTHKERGVDAVLDHLSDMARRVVGATRHIGDFDAVGISCGGPLDAASGILRSPLHLPDWVDVSITDLFADEFSVPAFLENDATAAALGEFHFGAGRGSSTLVYLTVSTGIGGGSVVDGRLMRGSAGNGGEHGHITVRPGGRACSCGRYGCLEAYCSGTSIGLRGREAAQIAAASRRSTGLTASSTAVDVTRLAQVDDEVAREIWDETTELLAQACTDLANVFEPEVLVLGGGVTRSGKMLLDPVRDFVLAHAMRPVAATISVRLAELGDLVGLVGAGAIAQDGLARLARN
ncbi:glucokinase [Paraoerskovia marina]|uniref:Glucokinase n=1 Tax=Paraoerskovia marina TaxID=545619 RepID=A0A1H1VTB8_9CELL|nr:ROK family protein [Paraoerskovia marina]SDS87721.1 glucokinase [Paraoerskovia marina]